MLNDTKEARNGKIEFLRFVFCMAVLLFHGKNCMTDGKARIMLSGRLGVEFFYIVSGYLMARAVSKMYSEVPARSIGCRTEQYLLRKVKGFYPHVIIAYFMNLCIGGMISGFAPGEIADKIVRGASNLALVQMSGIMFYTINGTWYISSMLLCMAILVPLMLKHYAFMRRIGLALIAVLVFGGMMQQGGGLGGPTKVYGGFLLKGNLRALAELSIGALCFEAASALRNVPFKPAGKILLAGLEAALYGIILLYVMLHKGGPWDYYITILMAFAITISFSGIAAGNAYFNNKVSYFLGKSTLYLYLGHLTVARDLTRIVGTEMTNRWRMVVYVLLAMLSAWVLYFLTEQCKKLLGKIHGALVYEG